MMKNRGLSTAKFIENVLRKATREIVGPDLDTVNSTIFSITRGFCTRNEGF